MLDSTGTALELHPRQRADVLVLRQQDRVDDGATSSVIPLFDAPARSAPEARLVDEAALRELVAHLVRVELNDSFGVRLTRQIRSLVRREVFRLVGGRIAD
jgi:hypothetical protein